jgi:hypothetical protein
MRLGLVTPVILSLFGALACGGKQEQSQVDGSGTAATGNNGLGGGFSIGNGSGAANGNSTGGGGDAFDPTSACANSAADGQLTPVDLFFMVDITGSMDCVVPDAGACDTDPGPPVTGDSRWTLLSAALKTFVADPKNQGLGVGIRFFPVQQGGGGGGRNNAVCTAASYLTPAVEIGQLPGNAALLTAAIDAQKPGGTTPTVPSLDAAIQHASAWAKANPTHRVAVVYATDGYPKGCTGNTIMAAAQLATAGFAATPSIPTYVLGVGPNLADLDQIALAGSNMQTKSFLVDTTQNAATQFTAALASIRSSTALDCTYTIPKPPAGQTLEPGKVNVNYTDSKGVVTKVKQDPAGVACAAGSGWQYSADGTQIDLCGSTCNAVKADKGGKLQVLFGCTTEVGIPPR